MADLSSIAEQINAPLPSAERRGCGPLVAPDAEAVRPLRQQLFEAIRAAGQIARAQLARDLRVSPASVTTVTSELMEAGLIEETVLTRDGEVVRGRPPVGIAVRPGARLVAGMKISDREHTAVVVDFAGGLVADAAVPCQPGPMDLAALLEAADALLARVTAAAGIGREDLAAVGLGVPGFVDMRAGTVLWSPVLGQRRAQGCLRRQLVRHLDAVFRDPVADIGKEMGIAMRIERSAALMEAGEHRRLHRIEHDACHEEPHTARNPFRRIVDASIDLLNCRIHGMTNGGGNGAGNIGA
ncbi:MAG: hypothetical protein ACK4WC_15245, partial [Rubrimonas sp.]